MRPGDAVLVYHTGEHKAVVALAHVRATAAAATSAGENNAAPKRTAADQVEIAFDRWLRRPVSLAEIKQDKAFADFALVRIGRLSVMPVTATQWSRVLKMSESKTTGARK